MAAQSGSIDDLANNVSLKLYELDQHSSIIFSSRRHEEKIDAVSKVSKIFEYFLSICNCPEGLGPVDSRKYTLIINRLRYALNDYYTGRIFSQMFNSGEYKSNAACKKLLFNRAFKDSRQIEIFNKIKEIVSRLFEIRKEKIKYSTAIQLYRILISENFNNPIFFELKPKEITIQKVKGLMINILEKKNTIPKDEVTMLDLENMASAYELYFALRRGVNILPSFNLPFNCLEFRVATPEERNSILEDFKRRGGRVVKPFEVLMSVAMNESANKNFFDGLEFSFSEISSGKENSIEWMLRACQIFNILEGDNFSKRLLSSVDSDQIVDSAKKILEERNSIQGKVTLSYLDGLSSAQQILEEIGELNEGLRLPFDPVLFEKGSDEHRNLVLSEFNEHLAKSCHLEMA